MSRFGLEAFMMSLMINKSWLIVELRDRGICASRMMFRCFELILKEARGVLLRRELSLLELTFRLWLDKISEKVKQASGHDALFEV